MKKLVLLVACALVGSVLAPAMPVDAAATPASTCNKTITSTATTNLTFPNVNTPGQPSFARMTSTVVFCWKTALDWPTIESSYTTCVPLSTSRSAKPGLRAQQTPVGIPGDPHSIGATTTCRVRMPNFKGKMSVYRLSQTHVATLGAWFRQPYVVKVHHNAYKARG